MKVALLGAPGSGKTKVGASLVRRLNHEFPRSFRLADCYVDALTHETGHTFGGDLTYDAYRHNLQVLAQRWVIEDKWTHRGFHTITCGTIFESMIYSAAYSTRLHTITDEQLLMEESYSAQVFMSMLGVMAARTFDYDALFYLPLEGDSTPWGRVVDDKLPEVLEGQMKYAVVLTGTHKQKVDFATDVIARILRASQAPSDEQPTIRTSDDASSGDEHQPLVVPDVSLPQGRGGPGDLDLA